MKSNIWFLLILIFVVACSDNEGTPDPVNTKIISEDNYQGEMNSTYSFNISLTDADDKAISGGTISVSILSGDAVFTTDEYTTSAQGEATITLDLKESYSSSVRLIYTGNDNFNASQKNVELIGGYSYRMPEPSSGIEPGNLIDSGIDEALITQLVDNMRKNDTKYQYINGLLIQHKGKLILEEYFPFEELIPNSGLQRSNGTHYIASVSKSITSACIGIALEKGFINSLDDTMLSYFPDTEIQNLDDAKRSITIRNLLHMQSGLNCNDTGSWANVSEDYIKYHLDLPMAGQPGTNFTYCTGVTMILGAIIEKASGLNAQDFANQYLLGPMGIATEDSEWGRDPSGNVMCGYNLWMKGRDMIKFGQLFLNEGVWQGEQIIPKSWTEASVISGPPLTFANRSLYGYQWWVGDHTVGSKIYRAYYAVGNGGNYVINIPELETVVAFYGAEWNSGTVHTTVEVELMDQLIIPAIEKAG